MARNIKLADYLWLYLHPIHTGAIVKHKLFPKAKPLLTAKKGLISTLQKFMVYDFVSLS